jgi:DNA-binding NarL/FixJ family response regulator
MIKVILTEDHPLVIEGVKAMLENETEVNCIATCNTGDMLRHLLQKHQPDIVLMDINLPDINGIELCKEVKKAYPCIGIIALSINNHPSVIRQMTESGANGYVLKDAGKQEILSAIKAVAQHKSFFSRSVALALRSHGNQLLPSLTRREKEVLELISDGFTNREIAEKLFVDISTVDSHRKNMLSKYDVKNTSALIKLAITKHLL